jgi:hypothetical protein
MQASPLLLMDWRHREMQIHSPERDAAQITAPFAITLAWASRAAAACAFGYALYRAYYAMGGTFGMFGIFVSGAQWRLVNGVGAVILLIVAIMALATPAAWSRPALRTAVLALCWLMTVGFVMHAIVDVIQRLLSLSGLLTLDFPLWLSVNRRESDLQDLLFNEPWFLIEGLLWGAIAWSAGLSRAPHRRWWVATAVIAIVALTINGLLAATGVVGKFIVG